MYSKMYGKIAIEDYKEVKKQICQRTKFLGKIRLLVNNLKMINKKDQDIIKVYIPKLAIDDHILGYIDKFGNSVSFTFCRSHSDKKYN